MWNCPSIGERFLTGISGFRDSVELVGPPRIFVDIGQGDFPRGVKAHSEWEGNLLGGRRANLRGLKGTGAFNDHLERVVGRILGPQMGGPHGGFPRG